MTIVYTHVGPAPVPERARRMRVRTRDGVHLATDVYLVDGEIAPRPVVLTRTPYDIGSDFGVIPAIAEYFNQAGYHFVAQDVRGKFNSEGETLIFVNEVNDGYDTIEWIVNQAWSDGTVAMWGDSYYGYTQWAAASSKHPALAAISPRITGLGLGQHPDFSIEGNTRDVYQSLLIQYTTSYFHDQDGYEWQPQFDRRPYIAEFREFERVLGKPSPSLGLYHPHPLPVRRFPEGHPFDRPAIPTLITTGWWDNCALWVWRDYWELRSRPDWNSMLHLVIDPVDHNYNFYGEDPTWGNAEARSHHSFLSRYLDPSIEFFNYYLRKDPHVSEIPKARWNLVGTEGYQVSSNWPPEETIEWTLFPTTDGRLTDEAPDQKTPVQWVHDPNDPVPAPLVDTFNFIGERVREEHLSLRDDVLVFSSDPAQTATDLVGRVRLSATVSSSGPKMDVIVRLYDVDPEGSMHRISSGQRHLLDAREPFTMTVEMDPVGYRLPAGHALRLHIASSEFPTYLPQPGTLENEWDAVEVLATTQTLQLGAEFTSLTLGVRPSMG